MALLSRLRGIRRGNSSLQPPHHRSVAPRPEVGSLPTPELDDISLSQHNAQIAQDLRSSLPSACRWIAPENVDLIGKHPIAAGGVANIWEGTHDGHKVILKSYRCYVLSDVTQIVERFCNEAHVWALLHHQDANIVPLVGVYSTEAHPFGLVYEYMDGLDLRQYLRNGHKADRLNLLAGIGRGLSRMHDLGVIHGNIRTVNILVDKDGTPRIHGLGNAVLHHSKTWMGKGSSNADQLSRCRAPEIMRPGLPLGPTGPTHPTGVSDVYAFGVMTWEVFTGRPPFFDMTEIAATYSMLSGARPPRPNHHEIPDRVWDMIEQCWDGDPSRRLSVGEVVHILETELGRMPDSPPIAHV